MFDISKPFRYDLVKLLRLRTSSSNKGVRIWRPFWMEDNAETGWAIRSHLQGKWSCFAVLSQEVIFNFQTQPTTTLWTPTTQRVYIPGRLMAIPLFHHKKKTLSTTFHSIIWVSVECLSLIDCVNTIMKCLSLFSPDSFFEWLLPWMFLPAAFTSINLPWMMKLPNIVSDRLS